MKLDLSYILQLLDTILGFFRTLIGMSQGTNTL